MKSFAKKNLVLFFTLLCIQFSPCFAVSTILPLGDSLTVGVGSGAAGIAITGGYRKPLMEALDANGLNVMFVGPSLINSPWPLQWGGDRDTYHAGFAGYRIDQLQLTLTAQLWFPLYGQGALLTMPYDVDAVLLMAGSNDILQGVAPWDAINKLKFFIGSLRFWYPAAQIIVATVPPLFSSPYVNPIAIANIVTYNALIRAAMAEYVNQPVHMAEIYNPLASGVEFANGDGIHPSSVEGYRKIAASFFNVLKTLPLERK